jgi:FAD dependent oxidoreductase
VVGRIWSDEIGVSTSLSPKFANVSVPYGALVPAGVDGVLAAGRHISSDANSHTFLREIPQCWMTGQAAGIAAALAANSGVQPRNVDPRKIQRELLNQGVYLSPAVEAAASAALTAAE